MLIPNVSHKPCSRCKGVLPVSEFYPHRRMKSGLQSHCRTCARQWHHERPEYVKKKNMEFKAKNPTYSRDRARIVNYGVSPEQIDALRLAQSARCAGCMRPLAGLKECLDHCHATGLVRGLLCNDCNVSLGRLREEPETLRRLASYVERNTKSEAEAHS